MMKRTCKQ